MPDSSVISSSVTQFQVFLAIFIPLVSVISAVCIAWGGNRYAVSSHEELIAGINQAITKMQEDMQQAFKDVYSELNARVYCNECVDHRRQCYADRASQNGEGSKQIALLIDAIKNQDEKRDTAKEKNHDMFIAILEKISDVEKKVAVIEAVTKNRENRFRESKNKGIIE